MHLKHALLFVFFALAGLMLAGCFGSGDVSDPGDGDSGLLGQAASLHDEDVLKTDTPYPQWLYELLFDDLESVLPEEGANENATLDCEGGEGTIDVYRGELPDHGQYDEELILEFFDCSPLQDENLSLSGTYRYRYGVLEEDDLTLEGEEWALSLEGSYDGRPFEASSKLSTGQGDHPEEDGQVFISSEPYRDWSFDDWEALTRDWQVFSEVDANMEKAEVTVSGRTATSQVGGYVDVSTLEPLRIETGASCPEAGVLDFDGDGQVRLRYGDDTGTGEAVVIELNDQRVAGFDSCDDAADEYAWFVITD